jgi:Homeodomain-like domain
MTRATVFQHQDAREERAAKYGTARSGGPYAFQHLFVRLPLLPPDAPDTVDVNQVMRLAGVSLLTVQTWIAQGAPASPVFVSTKNVGNVFVSAKTAWSFDRDELNDWLRAEREIGVRRYHGLPEVGETEVTNAHAPCVVCGQWGFGRRNDHKRQTLLVQAYCPYCGQFSQAFRERDILALKKAGLTRAQICAKLGCSQAQISRAVQRTRKGR